MEFQERWQVTCAMPWVSLGRNLVVMSINSCIQVVVLVMRCRTAAMPLQLFIPGNVVDPFSL